MKAKTLTYKNVGSFLHFLYVKDRPVKKLLRLQKRKNDHVNWYQKSPVLSL